MTSHLLQRHHPVDEFEDQPALTRPEIIWRARFSIVGVAILIAAATWAVSAFLPGTYSAYSDVLVSSRSAVTSVDAVNGANDLATQYAQLAGTGVVLSEAAAKSGLPVGELTAGTLVSTVANTNIVRVTVTADSASDAAKGSQAVANALVDQVRGLMTVAQKADPAQLAPLDKLLTGAKADVVRLTEALGSAKPGSAQAATVTTSLNNAQQQVSALTLKRIDLVSQASRDAGGQGVSLSLLTARPAASKVSPRPLLYSTVALIAVLIIMTELAVVSERRRGHEFMGRRRRSPLVG